MNFRDFVQVAERTLVQKGWLKCGHNGTWAQFQAQQGSEVLPLPAALIADMVYNTNDFQPTVELYLKFMGWKRAVAHVCNGWPVYVCVGGDVPFKRLPAAMMEQLKRDRLGYPAPTAVSGENLVPQYARR